MIEKNGKQYAGYAGKILRVNLTDRSTECIPSEKYLPENIGGRALANRIFWDEVGPGVSAFSPENKLILATGPTTGTAVPTGGRTTMTGISPNSYPEQYAYGSVGGRVGTELKYAGYDALIIEGKADAPVYLLIVDDNVQFLDARPIWGMLVHPTQASITLAHGPRVCSMVIGPAGENLCRNATITTSNDHALSKAGFGAVFGSKNLKAVAIIGNGEIVPGNIEKIMDLRGRVGEPQQIVNRILHQTSSMCSGNASFPADWDLGLFSCSPGCTMRCQRTMMGTESVFGGDHIDQIEKCVSPFCGNMSRENDFPTWLFVTTERNYRTMSNVKSWGKGPDTEDPEYDLIEQETIPEDYINFYGPSFDRGTILNQMCNEYGLDKWDMGVWYFTWIGMARQEGLLDDLDFGMDPDDIAFVKHFITCITYRRGIGDIFAEGMARAIRILGKEKYGDATYHGRTSADGEPRELPVSVEVGWGQTMHWSGRGYQGTPKWLWLINSLHFMTSTRDPICSAHIHVLPKQVRQFYKDGPSSSRRLVELAVQNEIDSVKKDSVTTCEWQAPNPFWPTLESEMMEAATGTSWTREELNDACNRGRLLFRAILMRNHGRSRDMEAAEVFSNMTFPDPRGEVATWDEWNEVVNMYYEESGYDLATGWPFRSTWEKYGLKDVADALEQLDMIPPEEETIYCKQPLECGLH